MPILQPITTDSSEDSDSSSSQSPRPAFHNTRTRESHYSIQSYGEDAVPIPDHVAPLELEKTNTAGSTSSRFNQRAQSMVSRIRSRDPGQIAKFTHPLSHTKTGSDVLVDFDGVDDPYHPKNWGFRKKCITTVLYGMTTMGATLASAIYTPGTQQISAEFHVGTEVSLLGLTLLLLGFGFGPLLWAPLSELYGRKAAVMTPYFIAGIFAFGTATAKDIQTVLITRFFTGFFGSAPVTNTGGVLGDIWSPQQRGAAIVGYAMAVLTGIYMLFILTLDIIFLDESYPPVLLVYKAQRLRHETGNWALHAKHEEWDVSVNEMANKYLVRPFALLSTPICFAVALYASFVYGILYLNLAAFPIEFIDERGWGQVVGELPFLSMLVGIMIGAGVNLLNQKFYISRFKKNNNRPVPEARLPPMMIGSIVFAAGMFIFAWTSSKSIHWIGPVIGAACMGLGFFTIFQAAINYLVDTFPLTAASAIAANTCLRSIFAAAFPLFTDAMYNNLGIDWAASTLGFISVALIPIPFLFYVFGKRLRARGKWSRASVYE
ncbi:uncharacterized protein BHQ10_001509 [Talaromyces amestolkiae]|uniref:Major facilitator superfamily (MFS) profile domain-containing protein n=1 Tax=Talaromyces amestolkiae TaxID=1196081 RepID=A0A364KPL3_TALAM|nr:uncharacterized protein BHQ10_001509 [Talaromyces amestolkiae]RAO65497.1 hypothetical protein BHQ10_001509 [Talaromyces amestolkiae]